MLNKMTPLVSIILPVRNEELFITSCLKSISAQDYPKEQIEVLIAEGMSDDNTLGSIAEYDSIDEELDITVLKNQKQTVSAGLNLGLRNAKGDVVIRMDAHAGYGKDYIKQCLAVMECTGAANVGGPALALPGGNTAMAHSIALAHLSPFGLGGAQFRDPKAEGFVETVWPGCFKREVFDKVGYIDERRTRTEDIEFNARLRAAGYKIYLSPAIKAYYYCRTTLWETWRQRWADGYEITHFLPDNPRAPQLRHFIPLIFVSSLILLTFLSWLSAGGWGYAIWGHGAGVNFLIRGMKELGLVKLPGLFSLKVWCWHLLFLRLLALELFAYLGAMAFFAGQAGRRQYKVHKVKKAESITQDEVAKAPGTTSPGLSTLGLSDFSPAPGSLLLLPLVFVTLHFSYGLGSLWGLATLAGWAGKRSNA